MADRSLILALGLTMLPPAGCAVSAPPSDADAAAADLRRPNIILCMADDLGWGDVGYAGNSVIRTPNLDRMASEGVTFTRFYAAAPVCSPTRGSCLTGRHPSRYGIHHANVGSMPAQELTLAERLQAAGYTTGHFGKWHLGTLTTDVADSNRGGSAHPEHYAPPWEHGFDVCFSTEAKVPTWDPMVHPITGAPYGTYYWTGPGERATENLAGDDSRVIMDRVIPFIDDAVAADESFFAVVWFHTPHKPCVAGPTYRAMYADHPEAGQHYFGCITAMDDQIGRLRDALAALGVADETMLFFCSDNGPEEPRDTPTNGSAGPLRGRKRSLFEGGVRVPGLLVYPDLVPDPIRVDVPCSTSDYVPTIEHLLGLSGRGPQPVDGESMLPIVLEGAERVNPIGFRFQRKMSLVGNRYKVISVDEGKTFVLFDLAKDPGETHDLAAERPSLLASMRGQLLEWRASCDTSLAGEDYD
jgi:arylsulfatase A-like enzyme